MCTTIVHAFACALYEKQLDAAPVQRQWKEQVMPAARGARSARNIEKRKKKVKRAMPRKKVSTLRGNTMAARSRVKKVAGKKRAARARAKRKA
jgi:hypothetical protein